MRRAKITVPLRPPGFVERPSVRAALEAQSEPRERGRVVLVSAPAGYGKTAAVTDWVRADPDAAAAWVGLDAGDRDERRWWASVLAALTACPAVAEDSPLHRVAPSWSDDSARDETVSDILEALDGMTVPVRLVLDDLQTIADHGALTGLQELLRHPLPMLTIVLCSRYDPPVGIDRLRLDDRLGQVRADQLAFTEPQAAELFRREGLDLDDDQTATLVARTEGWVAALRLASLSLHRRDDPAAFVREFAGDDRSVADYLVGEVLAHLGEREHAVLAAATVTSPLHLDLAVALTGYDDAGDVLDGLATSTAMVTATDRRREYYRVHELLSIPHARPAAAGAARPPPRALPAGGRVARRPRRPRRGPPVRAVSRATSTPPRSCSGPAPSSSWAAGSSTALARSEQMIAGSGSGSAGPVSSWGWRPWRTATSVARTSWSPTCDAELTDRRERRRHRRPAGIVDRAGLARARTARRMWRTAAQAIRTEDRGRATPLRALALVARASGLVDGEPEQARRDATEALALAERHGWPYLAVQAQSTLGLARSLGGDRSGSRAHARAAIARATSHGWGLSPGHLRARVLMATDEILGGRPEAALDAPPRRRGRRGPRASRGGVGARDAARRRRPRHGPATRRLAGHARRADGRRRPRPARPAGRRRRTRSPRRSRSTPTSTSRCAARCASPPGSTSCARSRALAEPLRAHLAAHQGAFGALDPLVDDVLAHRPDDLEAVRDPLTDRERTVLAFLPSQRSSVEIAQDLAVSLNTIKTHQRAIYHKLGVGSRREAVARARTVGLIDAPRTT